MVKSPAAMDLTQSRVIPAKGVRQGTRPAVAAPGSEAVARKPIRDTARCAARGRQCRWAGPESEEGKITRPGVILVVRVA